MGFTNQKVVVVSGAGFVGSNLVKGLLLSSAREVVVIDNLLSSEKENLPDDPRLTFYEGSVTDDRILAELSDDIDYSFQLATYHGNQSSIADPIADHDKRADRK